jgi:hypothetical protein
MQRLESGSGKTGRLLLGIAMTSLALLALFPGAAGASKARVSQGIFGSAAQPSFSNVIGLAVDSATGDVLVFDGGAHTLQRFKPNGEADPFSALGTNVIDAKKGPGNQACGSEPASCDLTPEAGFRAGAGFTGEIGVAVDNSGTVTNGNIYVTDIIGNEFEDFVDVFGADGHYIGQVTAAGPSPLDNVCGVTVDATGNLYVQRPSAFGDKGNKIYKFDPSANPPLGSDLVATFPTGNLPGCALAAGFGPSAGSLFSSRQNQQGIWKLDATTGAFQYLVDSEPFNTGAESISVNPANGFVVAGSTEWDATGATSMKISSFLDGPSGPSTAVSSDGSKVYTSSGSRVRVMGPVVTVPDVTTGSAAITGDTTVRLEGAVNPDGVLLEECYFEYGLTAPYGSKAPCSETPGEIGTNGKVVHADISGLSPHAVTYEFRLVAKNPNATIHGKDHSFSTPDEPKIIDRWATEVNTTEAKLAAIVNPENSPSSYRFEYGDEGPCSANPCSVFPAPPDPEPSAGTEASEQIVTGVLEGLTPDMTYDWRVVVTNNLGTVEAAGNPFHTFAVPDPFETNCPNQQFRTGGVSAALPNCRAYERVSPQDKGGVDPNSIVPFLNIDIYLSKTGGQANAWTRQARPDGSAITWTSARAFAEPEAAPYSSQFLSTRDPEGGWKTKGITPPSRAGHTGEPRLFFDFQAFTPDLCGAYWLQVSDDVPLAPGDQVGYPDLYRRENCASPVGYQLLTTRPPSAATKSNAYHLHVQGFSADTSRAVFRAAGKLETAGTTASGAEENNGFGSDIPISQVYMATGPGKPRLVSVMPNGVAAFQSSSVGGNSKGFFTSWMQEILDTAVSTDATRVFFTTPMFKSGSSGDKREPKLYLRLNANKGQSPITGGECTDPERGCTIAVSQSVDPGAAAEFWQATPEGTKVLFSFTAGAHKEELYSYDVGTQTPTLIAGGLVGVYGASTDLSKVYIQSTEALAPGGQAGKPNMYVFREGQGFTFIATLDKGGDPFSGGGDAWAPYRRLARVTTDGDHFAFFSSSQLTGYDSKDADPEANSKRTDGEVFLFDATANGGSGKLICISCNPSGGRPVGRELQGGAVPVAADIPGWETSFHPSPVLSQDGVRLVFESYDALLPNDVNGLEDVYQWEAPGAGDCDTTDSSYFPQNGGCLSLISGGVGSRDSELMDVSSDGSDVFFASSEQLYGGDTDLLVDVDDARVGGGFSSPQIPPECDVDAGACEGEGSTSPDIPGAGTPQFEGPGNEHRSLTPKCRRGFVRRHGKCVKKHRPKHRRATRNQGRTGR